MFWDKVEQSDLKQHPAGTWGGQSQWQCLLKQHAEEVIPAVSLQATFEEWLMP